MALGLEIAIRTVQTNKNRMLVWICLTPRPFLLSHNQTGLQDLLGKKLHAGVQVTVGRNGEVHLPVEPKRSEEMKRAYGTCRLISSPPHALPCAQPRASGGPVDGEDLVPVAWSYVKILARAVVDKQHNEKNRDTRPVSVQKAGLLQALPRGQSWVSKDHGLT